MKTRPDWSFVVQHPWHAIALGMGSGMSPWAPGTVGTLWAWAVFHGLSHLWPTMSDSTWALGLSAAALLGIVACTITADHLQQADPGAIVWDEIVAFGLVLWMIMPAGLVLQALAFAVFRYFDAVKPGPVGWADRLFKHAPTSPSRAWQRGLGIMLDDIVAAGCTLFVMAVCISLSRV